MDPPYRLQPINAHIDRADGLSRPEQHSWFSILGIGPGPYAQPSNTPIFPPYYTPPYPSYARPSHSSSLQSYYTAPDARPSHSSSTYYSADSSLSYSTMNSASTWSSNMSFPYSVTSINSRKSRKNVLYPRRAHPLPVAVPSEHFSISPEVRFFSSPFL